MATSLIDVLKITHINTLKTPVPRGGGDYNRLFLIVCASLGTGLAVCGHWSGFYPHANACATFISFIIIIIIITS